MALERRAGEALGTTGIRRFLTYYADAPEIVQPTGREEREEKGNKRDRRDDKRNRNAKGNPVAEEGYTRLFLNFGKRDNFFAREIINLVNRYVKGKVEIGRIDLLVNCSFFEVPQENAALVMAKMAKAKVGERRVVVDYADRADGQPADREPAPKRGRARTIANPPIARRARPRARNRTKATTTTAEIAASARAIGSSFRLIGTLPPRITTSHTLPTSEEPIPTFL